MNTRAATMFLTMVSFVPLQAKANQTEAPQPKLTDPCVPPVVVASFLGFTDTEAAQLGVFLDQFQTTLHGLQAQIAPRQTQLEVLLGAPIPDPASIGNLLLQIHALQQQVSQAMQSFQTQFASLLTDEQKQKVQAVTQASQLLPVVGAFVVLNLVPAPTPLPCQKQ
jgi:Spy/CpxP family protein refolding chaperone